MGFKKIIQHKTTRWNRLNLFSVGTYNFIYAYISVDLDIYRIVIVYTLYIVVSYT